MRAQLSGTIGAAFDVSLSAVFAANGAVDLQITNIGHTAATKMAAKLSLAKRALPSNTTVGAAVPLAFALPTLMPQQEIGDMIQAHPYDYSVPIQFSESELRAFSNYALAIRVEGSLTYNDGFSLRKRTQPVCVVWVNPAVVSSAHWPSQRGVACDQFDRAIGAVLTQLLH